MKKIILFLIVALAFLLRIYKIGEVPPSLYWDEASLGYNAYAISQTLHDEHGEFLPVTRFMAFGDYKPPGYIYAAALAIKIFGVSEFSVRLPSVIAGTLLVFITYFLTKRLIGGSRVSLLSAFFVAVSPWAIQFSRGAFEANLATLFSCAGILFFLYAVSRGKTVFYFLSSLFFAFSMYTFNTHKVFVPMLIISLVVIFRPLTKRFLLFAVTFALLVTPLAVYTVTPEAKLRFNEVSWVNDVEPIKVSNDRVVLDNNEWWSKIIHNRRIHYLQEFLAHYTDNFKGSFLFYSGDENKRLSIQSFGEMYWIELPLLLAGLYYLGKNYKSKGVLFIIAWLLLAPIPASLARETPHALRIFNIVPVPQILAAIGFFQLFRYRFLVFLFYLLSCFSYFREYFMVYPAKYDLSWQYGYKQMVNYVSSLENNYSCIDVTQSYGRPYIYFLLYNQIPPQKFWDNRQVDRDHFGFWYVRRFGKYYFDPLVSPKTSCLYVRAPKEVPNNAHILKTINSMSGEPVFVVYD